MRDSDLTNEQHADPYMRALRDVDAAMLRLSKEGPIDKAALWDVSHEIGRLRTGHIIEEARGALSDAAIPAPAGIEAWSRFPFVVVVNDRMAPGSVRFVNAGGRIVGTINGIDFGERRGK